MYGNPDAEDRLEREVMKTFRDELGYEVVNAFNEKFGEDGTLGRDNRSEMVLKRYLRLALERLNPGLPKAAYDAGIVALSEDRSIKSSLVLTNQAVYGLIKDGVTVEYPDPDTNIQITETLQVIDWRNTEDNHFLAVQQLWSEEGLRVRRPDIIVFVNGLPLVLIELKAVHQHLRKALDENIRAYKDNLQRLMWYNGFIILSNGTEARVGSISSDWDYFKEWKRIDSEGEVGRVDVETVIKGTCEKGRLLDIIENFVLYSQREAGVEKIICQNHQFLGVNNVIEAVHNYKALEGRLGVFWHTQGSGKSFSMVFLSQKVFRKVTGNWTFLIVTDRTALNRQIYKDFADCGIVKQPSKKDEGAQASDGENLKEKLSGDERYIFTTIQKFHTRDGQVYPVLSERENIIVITDEAHRTQYGTFAANMRQALPNASFIAFTGTPLIVGQDAEQTKAVFGDYVSRYDFQRSVEDNATVKLYYENRIPDLELVNEDMNIEIADVLDDANLSDNQEDELERRFSHEYQIITRDDRLERVARDIVEHFMVRGFAEEENHSKAMVVCIDRFTAVRMYDKVQRYWKEQMVALRSEQSGASAIKQAELRRQIKFMRETDMAVVISGSQNEVNDFGKRGLDIDTHRRRLQDEDLSTNFKKPEHPLRIVFVCAMWMTGFNVPSCATIYLDKPMRNHSLMQTIARANRVYRAKVNGLIVDYIGIFRNLEKALAIYGSASVQGDEEGGHPLHPQSEQIEAVWALIDEAIAFCLGIGIPIEEIMDAEHYYDRLALLKDVGEKVWASPDIYDEFINYVRSIDLSVNAILPNRAGAEFIPIRQLFVTIAKQANSTQYVSEQDIEDVAHEIESVLDDSVITTRWSIEGNPLSKLYDMSQIDFEKLATRFQRGHKRTSVEKLRRAMQNQLRQLVKQNRTRMDYLNRFNEMIARYNAGAVGVDEIFSALLRMVDDITEEEQRHVREGLSEEELAVFDLLVRPKKTLSHKERDAIKDTVKSLLKTLKTEKLKLDWRRRDQSQAVVRDAIIHILDGSWESMGLDDGMFKPAVDVIYDHVATVYDDIELIGFSGTA